MLETIESSRSSPRDVSLVIEGSAVVPMLENYVDEQDFVLQLECSTVDEEYKLHVFIDIEDKESLEDWRMVRKVYVVGFSRFYPLSLS